MDFVRRPRNERHRQTVDGFVVRPRQRPVSMVFGQDAVVQPRNNNQTPNAVVPQDETRQQHTSSTPQKLEPTKELKKTKRLLLRRYLKISGISFGALACCGLIVGVFVFGKAWLAAHKIFQGGGNSSVLFNSNIKPEALKGEGDGRINVLFLGIGGGDHDGANLTDSIVIASVDPIAKDVALLSIPRDLWVRVPNYWAMKINAAYAVAHEQARENGANEDDAKKAGFTSIEETITEYIGIPIHYHALVDFKAFAQGVDAVGGVEVDVKEDLYDSVLAGENGGNPLIARAGLQAFDGRRALLYAQSRYSTSDFARGERQRELLIALKNKVVSAGTFSNPQTISRLIDALGDNVSVNASLGEMLRMYEITKDIPNSSIVNIGLTDDGVSLVTTGSINDQSVVLPRAGNGEFDEIRAFVRNTLRDPFLKSEDATIAVLNGTEQPGLASEKANELRGYGYNVIIVDDAPTKDYAQTVIYERNIEKKYTRNYLEKRLQASVISEPQSTTPIAVGADFVVILGKDDIPQSSN